METKQPKDNGQNKESLEKRNKRTNREIFYALELVSKLGISVAFIAGSFVLLGLYLDNKFSTGRYHIFLFIGLALSVIVSIYDIYWLLEPVIGSEKRKNFLKRKKK